MADFTDKEKELLDKLGKSFERTGKTVITREPWQEHFDHDTSLNASRAALAAKIIEGFAGSWAAQYKYGWGSTINPTLVLPGEAVADADPQGPPVPIRAKTNKIGLRGVPEINFVPFNWYTNSFGTKGPALVGHPIAFDVVGPTLKSPFCNWTWDVSPGAGPNGGDLLTMSLRPDGGGPTTATLLEGYNIADFTIGGVGEPNGGLYIIITDDGANPGSIPVGATPMGALPIVVDTAKYEIFRVSAVSGTSLEVHPNKSLGQFFDLGVPSPRTIRALTILAPYVTRLQAIPQTGPSVAREQTYAIVTPEFAASSDLYPPYSNPGGAPGTWLTGGFTELTAPGSGLAPGAPGQYGGKNPLPIPIPLLESFGLVDKTAAATPTTLVGEQFIETSIFPYSIGATPKIIRVNNTQRDDDLPALTFGSIPACLGWFPVNEIIAGGTPGIRVGRVAEVDPQSGLVYYGPGPYISSGAATQRVVLGFTIHDPISSLWAPGTAFDIDKVEASRLKNLIDPRWVGRFEKQISDPVLAGGQLAPPAGSGPGRPDKAIFDTATIVGGGPIPEAGNPGNLEDLGFRIVLFPAKEDAVSGDAIPDFDKPITGRELIIDSSITEKQTVDYDYSAGLVRLSHPPPFRISDGDVIPNGIVGETTNNTRGEVVLFAACVPYSMEESQLGTGSRVTGSAGEGHQDYDVYSQEISAKLSIADMTFTVVPPFIGPSVFGPTEIVLDRLWDGPPTGVITLTAGSDTALAFGRWGYTEIRTEPVGAGGTPVTTLGGISSLPGVTNPDPSIVGGAQTREAILRREVFFGAESFSLPAITDFYLTDTVYGSSARANTLRFRRAKMLPQLDGSVSVQPLPDLAANLDRQTGAIIAAKMPYPLGNVTLGAPLGVYLSESGLLMPLDYQSNVGGTPGGIFRTDANGPSFQFTAGNTGPPSWHGVITLGDSGSGIGVCDIDHNLRFVALVSTNIRAPGVVGGGFVGFVQDEGGAPGVNPTVGQVTNPAALPPRYTVIGFSLDVSASTTWRIWTRGSSGVDNLIDVPGAIADPANFPLEQGPYYFVIETNKVGPGDLTSVEVKLGIYDKFKTLLGSTTVTNADLVPVPGGRGLFCCLGARQIGPLVGTNADMDVFHAKLVLATELDDLPPLP